MDQKKTIQQALIHSLPIMGSYLFVSMAYGLMMQEAGFGWGWSLLASMTVYTMTDETYAVNCSLLPAQGEESEQEKHRRFAIMA